MKMRKWMGIIAVLALLTWLVIPAVRIWLDPNLRSHQHLLSDPDPMKRLEMVSTTPAKTTRITARVFAVNHKASFWVRYRSLLLGVRWPPGDQCDVLTKLRGRIRPEGEADGQVFDQQIETENVSLLQ